MKKKLPREYAREFRAAPGTKGKAMLIDGIPVRFYNRMRSKVRRENRSMRGVVLGLLKLWLEEEPNGELAQRQTGSGVPELYDGDDLHAGAAEEAQSHAPDGEPGSAVSQELAGRVAAAERDVPGGGESVGEP